MTIYTLTDDNVAPDQQSVVSSDRPGGPMSMFDPEYQDYLAWLAAGNTPLPSKWWKASQAFQIVITQGVALTWTGSTSLNGVYACDPTAQTNIDSTLLSINITGKFTNGQNTRPWPDITGQPHLMTTDQFITFAAAIGSYIDRLATARAMGLIAQPGPGSVTVQG